MSAKTILIAEDDEANFKYLEIILTLAKYNIVRANNGIEAIKICESTRIDLILMDIRMPEMDGFEATIAIRKFNPTVPIIAQTAYTAQKDQIIAKEAGCNDFLTKPLERNSLLNTIKMYI